MSLIARHFEQNAIATVVAGAARDIVEHCGVPRFLFLDYPLGNPCGRPFARDEQRDLFARALALFETAKAPRTTALAPYRWSDDESWRDRYMEVREEDLPELRRRGEALRALREERRREGQLRKG